VFMVVFSLIESYAISVGAPGCAVLRLALLVAPGPPRLQARQAIGWQGSRTTVAELT